MSLVGSEVDAAHLLRLLEEQLWVNNPSTDAAEAGEAGRGTNAPANANQEYLRKELFPTLIPAIHDLLVQVQGHNDAEASRTTSRFRNVQARGGKVADGSGSGASTHVQCHSHTSSSRATEAHLGAAAPTHNAESREFEPFHGATGRVNGIEWIAQRLMRAHPTNGSGEYADHPFAVLERAYASKAVQQANPTK